ncbi:MAG: hypothetical protein WC758_08455 [Candidatus Woesearchaeota archaeon]|jgi:hypothetical protein
MTINIPLDSKFKIQSDSRQFILSEGNRAVAFFSDLESLVQFYFKCKILTSNANTINNLIEVHKSCLNALNLALAPLQIKVVGTNSSIRPKVLEKKQ